MEKDLEIGNFTLLLDSQTRENKIDEFRQPAVEKDKIIEEKQHQLEQPNDILVTFKKTLDEKQRKIAELVGSLNDKNQKVVELGKSLSKAGRTLQCVSRSISLLKHSADFAQLVVPRPQ